MIAGQDDDRSSIFTQKAGRAFEQFNRLAMIVERVTGEHDHVRTHFRRRRQDFGQNGQSILVAKAIISAEVKIRTVYDGYFWVWSHGCVRMNNLSHAIKWVNQMKARAKRMVDVILAVKYGCRGGWV